MLEFTSINPKTASCEELESVIKMNCATAAKIRTESEKLRRESLETAGNSRLVRIITDIPIIREEVPVQKEVENDSEFEEEIDFYIQGLERLSEEELRDLNIVCDVLPSRNHEDYNKIMFRITARYLREIKEIMEYLDLEDSMPDDDLQMLRQEVLACKRKMALLKEIRSQKVDKKEDQKEENRLVFVPTASGNIRVFDEIDHLPIDFYSDILLGLKSIKNGTFKKVKRFTDNATVMGISEVKSGQTRVIFDRLGVDTYAIISIILKKGNSPKAYHERLESNIANYRRQEESLKSCLASSEFMKLQSGYEQELYNKLGAITEGEKGLVKTSESAN